MEEVGRRARAASKSLAQSKDEDTRHALDAMAAAISQGSEIILEENRADVAAVAASGSSPALIDRLTLNERRIQSMVSAVSAVAEQPFVTGEIIEERTRPNGLKIQKVRVPVGVVAVIYEARPNVTVDVAALCLRSSNASILRGSSHALRTNSAIVDLLRAAVSQTGLPVDAIQLITDTSRATAAELMTMKQWVDLLIPRGGPDLIRSVEETATVPYIIDGDGNCHVYVDAEADPKKAINIVVNAKVSRPSVCNAAETLLIHSDLAESWLPEALNRLEEQGVEVRGDDAVRALWPRAVAATEEDWAKEYLDLILAVKVVDSLDQAIAHINRWGTSNAEAIVTEDPVAAKRFTQEVDSGSIFVNASTRFSDGGEFGFGSEIGISTQKLHARGPMGLRELTTYKYVVWGTGQVRK